MPKGDCFQKVIEVALDLEDLEERPLVVHGLPIGKGPANFGRRYWHAWVETEREGKWIVIDDSNDRSIRMDRERYYAIGHLTEQYIFRYTVEDALSEMSRLLQYGPWIDNWEDKGL